MTVQKMRKLVNTIIHRPEYKAPRYTYFANVSYNINTDLLNTLVPGRQFQYSITKINNLYKKLEGHGYSPDYYIYDHNCIFIRFHRFTYNFVIECI